MLPPPAPAGPIQAFTGTRRLFTLMTPRDAASRLGFWARIDTCPMMSECTGRHPCADFHARFSATERCYRYIICNTSTKSAALDGLVTWYRHTLNLDLMNEACHLLLGEQDFSAFRAASCQAKTPYRNINRCSVERRGGWWLWISAPTPFCTIWCVT